MEEVLLQIGTKVFVEFEDGETEKYLVIGKRQYSPNSGNSWDYIGVPMIDGYNKNNKAQYPYENSNLYFFNHTDIISVANGED